MHMDFHGTTPLLNQISQVLSLLELFFHKVEPEVERMGVEGDNGLSLMALMAIFNKVLRINIHITVKAW